MAKNNLYRETLKWIDAQLDKVHQESIRIGEKLLVEQNPEIIELLDKKLIHLEKEVSMLHTKFQYEKQNHDN